jgi:hypothetical protein
VTWLSYHGPPKTSPLTRERGSTRLRLRFVTDRRPAALRSPGLEFLAAPPVFARSLLGPFLDSRLRLWLGGRVDRLARCLRGDRRELVLRVRRTPEERERRVGDLFITG